MKAGCSTAEKYHHIARESAVSTNIGFTRAKLYPSAPTPRWAVDLFFCLLRIGVLRILWIPR
jgi:hypothetical protein